MKYKQVVVADSDKQEYKLVRKERMQFAVMVRNVPAMSEANMLRAVEAAARVSGVRDPVKDTAGVRPKQRRAPDGEYDTTAYTGSVTAYFYGEAPDIMEMEAEATIVLKGGGGRAATICKPMLLRDGDYKLLDEETCFGCGAVISRTDGEHVKGCGRAERERIDKKRKEYASSKEDAAYMREHVERMRPKIMEDHRKGEEWTKKAKKARNYVCPHWIAGGRYYAPCAGKSNCAFVPCILIKNKVTYATK